jgi:dipeptidyl aminopeptidase/acylaminoacyl peptidase
MIFYILLFVAVFLVFISFWGFWQATHPPKIISNTTPKDLGWEFEKVSLQTEDGLKLAGWFVPTDKNLQKAIILLHGYPTDKGDLLHWASFLKDKYNLLFFDFRYFGQSEGSFTSLGYHERKDVLSAIDFLKKKGISKIGLMGFSYGASVALLTLPQASDVEAVVADSAFANLDLMGKIYWGKFPYLEKLLMALSKLWGRLIYGIDAARISPEQAAKKVKTPIFVIHSRKDELILVENAKRLEKALSDNKNAQVWIYDRGVHGELAGQGYEERILQFFEKHLI